MIQSAPETSLTTGGTSPQKAYLHTFRAQAARSREFNTICDAFLHAAGALASIDALATLKAQRLPDRCIVQFPSHAVTLTWLRQSDDNPSGGSLMVMIWKGVIAARGDIVPERLRQSTRIPPTVLWEESCSATASSEDNWHWHPRGPASVGYTSSELVSRWVEQLQEITKG